MKKQTIWVAVIAVIVANVFFSTIPDSNRQSRLSLAVLQAKADGTTGETDIPDPDDLIFPMREFPKGRSLSAIIDYFSK